MDFIKNYWFPLLIAMIVLIILLFFGDFSVFIKINGNRNKNIYKIYQLYDRNSEPVSYEYKILELNKNLSSDKVIKELIKKIEVFFPKNTEVLNYELNNNILYLNLSKDFIDNYPMDEQLFLLNLNSIVNTFTYLKNIKGVSFKVEGNEIQLNNININYSKVFFNNIEEFIVYSPLNDPLLTFFYNDPNYTLNYVDKNNNEYKLVTINEKKNLKTIFNITLKSNEEVKKSQQSWEIKNNGLYIDNILILQKKYKVEDIYKISNYKAFIDDKRYNSDCLVKKIYKDKDNSIVIILEITIDKLSEADNKYTERLFLKQGYGLIRHEINDHKNNNFYYEQNKRIFVGDK